MWLPPRCQGLASGPLAPRECVQRAGDVVYVPAGWLHATNNLNDCVGVAVDHPVAPQRLVRVPAGEFHFGHDQASRCGSSSHIRRPESSISVPRAAA